MGIARTPALALTAVIAGLLLGASVASAATGIEFSNETTGEHCDLSAGNCEIFAHSTQETAFASHPFGFEFDEFRCEDEFTGYIGENGEGHLVNQILFAHPDDFCGKESCTEDGEGEWPFEIEEDAGGAETMRATFCVQIIGNPSNARHCTIDIDVSSPSHDAIELSATDEWCGDGLAEVTGHWIVEPQESEDIRMFHFDD